MTNLYYPALSDASSLHANTFISQSAAPRARALQCKWPNNERHSKITTVSHHQPHTACQIVRTRPADGGSTAPPSSSDAGIPSTSTPAPAPVAPAGLIIPPAFAISCAASDAAAVPTAAAEDDAALASSCAMAASDGSSLWMRSAPSPPSPGCSRCNDETAAEEEEEEGEEEGAAAVRADGGGGGGGDDPSSWACECGCCEYDPSAPGGRGRFRWRCRCRTAPALPALVGEGAAQRIGEGGTEDGHDEATDDAGVPTRSRCDRSPSSFSPPSAAASASAAAASRATSYARSCGGSSQARAWPG